jgi:hypothetical protein
MIDRLALPDPVTLQNAANVCFTFAAWLSGLWLIGWLGYRALGSSAPRPAGGDWRRRPDGHPVCPGCADVLAGDSLPLQPLATTLPVDPGEPCDCCPAYRAEEEA